MARQLYSYRCRGEENGAEDAVCTPTPALHYTAGAAVNQRGYLRRPGNRYTYFNAAKKGVGQAGS